MSRTRTSLMQFLVAMALLVLAAPLAAHSTPNSEVRLSVAGKSVTADIIVPRGEYAIATGHPVDGSARSIALARDYLRNHIAVVSQDQGRQWAMTIRTVEFVQSSGPPDLYAVADLSPPHGAPLQNFTIDWRVLTEELPGHFALIMNGGPDLERGAIIGAVRKDRTKLDVELVRPRVLDPLVGGVVLGAHHILEGYDHLLFLLVLLLPAPLVARSGNWTDHRTNRATLVQLSQIVTAFTFGHSLTLIAAVLGRWSLPIAPVEIAIAISVFVSAMHAVRPLVPGKEPIVAIAFGLVHGLAFATLVQNAQAEMTSGALTLVGFNIGIELVQLSIVAAVVPSLIVLSRHSSYDRLRTIIAYLAIAAATAWIVNRATGLAERLVASMESAMSQLGWLVLAAAAAAFILKIRDQASKRWRDEPERIAQR